MDTQSTTKQTPVAPTLDADLTDRRNMPAGTIFRSALRALSTNKLRSSLTMLGMIIGVGAVIAAVTLTQGVSTNINQRFASLGTNVVYVIPGATQSSTGVHNALGAVSSLTLADASALTGVAHVTATSPIISTTVQAVYSNQNKTTTVFGVYPIYQSIANWQMAEGTWFSDEDEATARPVAVLGAAVVQNLFGSSTVDPLGQLLRVNTQILHIVGTLQAKGTPADDSIFMPLSAFQQRLQNTPYLSQINVQIDDINNIDQVEQDITTVMTKRHNTDQDFRVFASSQIIQNAQANSSTLTGLLIGIAAVSLTVGGIGIMNIMLVSVTERTREIGIRMAIGAHRSDIRNQFLIEALILSIVGGIVGIVIGLLGGYEIVQVAQMPFVINASSILLPVGVAATIGIIFGLYPAISASHLDPIVALHTQV